MGQGQSSSNKADVMPEKSFNTSGKDGKNEVEEHEELPIYPNPTGHEYDEIDKLQAELPSMIDEESQQQVDDYMQACDKGKGPMVACFATAEYLSMFERKVCCFQILFFSILAHTQADKLPVFSTKKLLTCLKMCVFDH